MLDFLLAMIYGVTFFFLWWKIGVILMNRFGDKGLGNELIILLWPLPLILGTMLIYSAGKLIIILIEKVL